MSKSLVLADLANEVDENCSPLPDMNWLGMQCLANIDWRCTDTSGEVVLESFTTSM